MKFDYYKQDSIYVGNTSDFDKKRFERAFNPKVTQVKKVVKGADGKELTVTGSQVHYYHEDRQWVRDVLSVFAFDMGITDAQAIQSFKTGDYMALKRVFDKQVQKMLEGWKELLKRTPADHHEQLSDLQKAINACNEGLEMTSTAWGNKVKSSWEKALGVRHPSIEAKGPKMESEDARRKQPQEIWHDKTLDPRRLKQKQDMEKMGV